MGWVLVVAVMISAVSSTQTTILPTARGTLAMAAYKALPKRFATVHPRYKTPSFSTLVMGIVAIVYYVGMTLISDNILPDSILSLGLAIAFYYGDHRLRLLLVLPPRCCSPRRATSSSRACSRCSAR